MLTADLVTVRRRGDELRLAPLDDDERARAAALAGEYLTLARAHVGRSRQELDAAWQAIPVAAREQRLAAGVRKLVSDRCLFTGGAAADDSVGLRAQLFAEAARVRRALAVGEPFDRAAVLATVAAQRETDAVQLEAAMFADLHGAELLTDVEPVNPTALAARFDLAQAQGVLLRAVRVVADVRAGEAGRYRALFSKLKFLRLLHRITPLGDGDGKDRPQDKDKAKAKGYRIEIDGPFSLFQSVTRYGLQLGLALPALTTCDAWQLEADVLWGRYRRPLRFRWAGKNAPDGDVAVGAGAAQGALPDDVAALIAAVERLDGPWRVRPASEVLNLPGVGLCVPDLLFTHQGSGARAFLEVMGFWSREAVWRRIDLVRAGLLQPIVFAVSKQLRVSEAALDGDLPGALYVYARAMNAKAIIARVEAVAR